MPWSKNTPKEYIQQYNKLYKEKRKKIHSDYFKKYYETNKNNIVLHQQT